MLPFASPIIFFLRSSEHLHYSSFLKAIATSTVKKSGMFAFSTVDEAPTITHHDTESGTLLGTVTVLTNGHGQAVFGGLRVTAAGTFCLLVSDGPATALSLPFRISA